MLQTSVKQYHIHTILTHNRHNAQQQQQQQQQQKSMPSSPSFKNQHTHTQKFEYAIWEPTNKSKSGVHRQKIALST